MDSRRWQLLEDCPDHLAAEVIAGLLRAESVPVYIQDLAALPGLTRSARVFVPQAYLHRAKWVLAQAPVTEAELEWLAIGTLPGRSE